MKFRNLFFYFLLFQLVTLSSFGQSYVPIWNDSRVKARTIELEAFAFDLKDVELLDSPFKDAMKATSDYLLKVEPDRLLSQFRSNAGLEPKGEIYGGWESAGLAGHSLGHYLSACAMYYAVSQDDRYLERVNYIVDELEQTQEARGNGYIGAIPKEDSVWAEVKKGNITARDFYLNGAWSPFYTLHKIMAGLLDAYLYADNEKALAINTGIADWTGDLISGLSDSLRWKMLICEYGGMNETLVNTYAFTGNEKYLELSKKFQDNHIVDSIAMGINVLKGKHSNTQIPKFTGVIRRYELTGEERDLETAKFFWETMLGGYTYATGGNSNYERLPEYGKLGNELTDNTTETCNTYNMLKLGRHLFSIKPNASLMNYYERALYNHILPSQNPQTGMVCYFVPLRMGTKKRYSSEFNSFTCCHGSGMENHVKYGESIYSRGKGGELYVNLFIPSILNWKEKGVVIRQETEFPKSDEITIKISEGDAQFPLRIRVPSWIDNRIHVENPVVIRINGLPIENLEYNSDGYYSINRYWRSGDELFVSFPMYVQHESMPDKSNRVALFYGPTLLAGVFGEVEPDPEVGIPAIISDGEAEQWIKPVEKEKLHFQTQQLSDSSTVNLIPFYETVDEYYSVYWDVYPFHGLKEEVEKTDSIRERNLYLESKTIDLLSIGDKESEALHEFEGEEVKTGENHRKAFIRTGRNGSFSFVSKVNKDLKNTLHCIYWGEDNRGRAFDIFIDDELLSSVELVIYKGSKFHKIAYEIPEEFVNEKEQVRITFKAHPENIVGPIYGIRMIADGNNK